MELEEANRQEQMRKGNVRKRSAEPVRGKAAAQYNITSKYALHEKRIDASVIDIWSFEVPRMRTFLCCGVPSFDVFANVVIHLRADCSLSSHTSFESEKMGARSPLR